ncbi:MAG: substrate-binding domain-containing protein [Defluviitaleaceae bacterium]|nr:substrate-binding domain-containing protein [Defluviitaleaceae bacterium]
MQKFSTKIKLFLPLALLTSLLLSGCYGMDGDFNANMTIAVMSREDGSGTRGAFVEMLGIERNGVDHTFIEADIQHSGGAVLTSVIANIHSIGYISLGSLNSTVSSVSIDGVLPTADTVRNGTYPIFRAFYFAFDDLTELAQDFVNFVLSAEGQQIAANRGYVSVSDELPAFAGSTASGRVVITGSTSVFPIVEVLGEKFETLNPSARIEVHSSGSSAGITAAIDGTADIGMSSRALNPNEIAQINSTEILFDGLAIIVNNNNPVQNMSVEEVRQVFEGKIFNWYKLKSY